PVKRRLNNTDRPVCRYGIFAERPENQRATMPSEMLERIIEEAKSLTPEERRQLIAHLEKDERTAELRRIQTKYAGLKPQPTRPLFPALFRNPPDGSRGIVKHQPIKPALPPPLSPIPPTPVGGSLSPSLPSQLSPPSFPIPLTGLMTEYPDLTRGPLQVQVEPEINMLKSLDIHINLI